ncbi:hypothetical protein SLE2022_157500 [Rubroshorea leprosula]
MEGILFHTKSITHIFFLLLPFLPPVLSQNPLIPLPPLPLVPEILTFLDQRLAIIYPIIQTFKTTITLDPFNITATWVGSDICSYKGFYCDHPPDNLTAVALASIDFNGFRLSAPTLDGFIDQLPDLAVFHANSNNFSGTISPSIAKLPYLYELDLSNNNCFGPFPTAVLGMTGLSFLDIRFNMFTGAVPPAIFFQTLNVLFLNNNNFIQNLPVNLGASPVLYLTLANNKFTGQIPRSIANASSTLTEVLLLNNMLTGCLPYELGFLRELRLFDAGNNFLTGPLPCSLGCLKKIEILNLTGNLLYGQIPEVLCALGSLVNLSLSHNYFTQVGPFCRKLIKSGVLDVSGNCIGGLPGQRSRHECALFFSHPRFCPYMASYNFIPCSIHNSSSNHSSPTRSKEIMVTYKTLTRHRLL